MAEDSRFKARPTTYKGIKMRSRLEAGFASWLDRQSVAWSYEPQCFASDAGQYLPDFRLDGVACSWLDSPGPVYVEVKPKRWGEERYWEDWDAFEGLMRRMAIIWESEPSAALVVARPPDKEEAVASVWMLDPNLSPIDKASFPWVAEAIWVEDKKSGLALARPVWGSRGPWAGEYWKLLG